MIYTATIQDSIGNDAYLGGAVSLVCKIDRNAQLDAPGTLSIADPSANLNSDMSKYLDHLEEPTT